jgi:endonuclease/exonuclease/phosphatase family metal-dependent hydrolase
MEEPLRPGASVTDVRLATWNILSGRSPGASTVDVGAFRDAVATLDADVLALQEVDRAQRRSQGIDLAGVAAEAMRAVDLRFVPALAGPPGSWRPATGLEAPDVPAYGIALLSRLPVADWEAVRLAGAPVRVPHRPAGRRRPVLARDEPRVAVVGRVTTPAGPMDVAATHLSFLRPWNARQLRRLLVALRHRGRPLVLMGDLNLGPRRVSRLGGMRPLVSGATFPADAPLVQIDHVLGDGIPAGSASGHVVRLALSDHRALVVDL